MHAAELCTLAVRQIWASAGGLHLRDSTQTCSAVLTADVDIQVEEVIFSTYDACTKADTEGPYKGKPFRAQVPAHVFLPWMPAITLSAFHSAAHLLLSCSSLKSEHADA